MTKTYSEALQGIYFKAARDAFGVAAEVLNDCTEPAEFRNPQTVEWAKALSKRISTQAYALEDLGHEQAIATAAQETNLAKAKLVWSEAISRHQRLVAEWNGVGTTHDMTPYGR